MRVSAARSSRSLQPYIRFPFHCSSDPTYSKWARSSEGELKKRYTAIDPANAAIVCTCGRKGCHRAQLLDFREHIAELYRVLLKVHEQELAVDDQSTWASVLYGLRMAASIEDVEADTGYVEDPVMFALCEPAIDYEDAQSEMASKYVAAATIFNFLWQSYEAIVSITAPDERRGLAKEQRFGERGRRLLEARGDLTNHFRGTSDLVKVAMLHCRRGGRMTDRCDRVQKSFVNNDLATAAELVREFRNFLFHGGDEAPTHEDWGDVYTCRCRLYRFYSLSRLLLYLMQAMAWITLDGEEGLLGYKADDDEVVSLETLTRLQFKM